MRKLIGCSSGSVLRSAPWFMLFIAKSQRFVSVSKIDIKELHNVKFAKESTTCTVIARVYLVKASNLHLFKSHNRHFQTGGDGGGCSPPLPQ